MSVRSRALRASHSGPVLDWLKPFPRQHLPGVRIQMDGGVAPVNAEGHARRLRPFGGRRRPSSRPRIGDPPLRPFAVRSVRQRYEREASPNLGRKSRGRQASGSGWHLDHCPACNASLFHRALAANLWVCPECGHHFRLDAVRRIETLVDQILLNRWTRT